MERGESRAHGRRRTRARSRPRAHRDEAVAAHSKTRQSCGLDQTAADWPDAKIVSRPR